MELIKRANKEYNTDLGKQADFIQFFATSKYGRHFQIFIYDYTQGRAGHCFNINLGEFIEIKYNAYMYYIWRVHLIAED